MLLLLPLLLLLLLLSIEGKTKYVTPAAVAKKVPHPGIALQLPRLRLFVSFFVVLFFDEIMRVPSLTLR